MFAVCWSVFVACCLVFGASYSLLVGCCLLFVVVCWLCEFTLHDCRLLVVGCCLL